jgi:hypothetical protein
LSLNLFETMPINQLLTTSPELQDNENIPFQLSLL